MDHTHTYQRIGDGDGRSGVEEDEAAVLHGVSGEPSAADTSNTPCSGMWSSARPDNHPRALPRSDDAVAR